MSIPRTWLPRIAEILNTLRASDAESFDRPVIEKLFEIQRRTALLLMNAAGCEKSGRFYTIKKENLIKYVESIDRTEAQEVLRRQHTLDRIDKDAEQWRAVRHFIRQEDKEPVRFVINDEISAASFSSLPGGILIEPGLILIKFDSKDPEEACLKLFALSKALVNDLGTFIRIMQGKAVSEETAIIDFMAALEQAKASCIRQPT